MFLTRHAWWHCAIGAAIVVGTAVAVVLTAGGALLALAAVASVAGGTVAATTASTVAAGTFIGTSMGENTDSQVERELILLILKIKSSMS